MSYVKIFAIILVIAATFQMGLMFNATKSKISNTQYKSTKNMSYLEKADYLESLIDDSVVELKSFNATVGSACDTIDSTSKENNLGKFETNKTRELLADVEESTKIIERDKVELMDNIRNKRMSENEIDNEIGKNESDLKDIKNNNVETESDIKRVFDRLK